MKVNLAKVIGTCFIGREVRLESTAWYEHAQNLPEEKSVLDMISFIVENENQVDSGLPMDTIIVNNDVGYQSGINYLNSIDGTKTKNGRIKIIHKDNCGRSFGCYDKAFKKYKNKYEYWMFCEDDMYFCKDGYAKHYLDILNTNSNCAFVATIGIGRPNHETKHAHGGCGFTHRDYMQETIPLEFNVDDGTNKQAFKAAGSLAYSKEDNKNTRIHCVGGEVPFTYSLVRLGYELCVDKKASDWYKFYNEG